MVYYFIGPEAALTKKDFRNLEWLKAFNPKFLKNLIYGFLSLNNATNPSIVLSIISFCRLLSFEKAFKLSLKFIVSESLVSDLVSEYPELQVVHEYEELRNTLECITSSEKN